MSDKTLLDEFAMAAMNAILTTADHWDEEGVARIAYSQAVAMMAERARRKAEE
jgi:hypothetical protein